MSLPERLCHELIALRTSLLDAGEMLPESRLANYADAFRRRFGPEALARLDGMALLEAMHLHGSQDSLVYWLEFKNDDEFESIKFGSIAGGTAHKFGVYWRNEHQQWITGSPQHPQVIPVEDAIGIARRHRDQLALGYGLLERLPEAGSDADYLTLQEEMDRVAPDVRDSAWGHKYFALLFPSKLDDYHVENLQRYQLIRSLQVPPEAAGRYVCGGRYVSLAHELDMPMQHLTSTLNRRNGGPHRYWRVGTKSGDTGESQWGLMREGQYVSIGWDGLGDLTGTRLIQESKDALRERVQQAYPGTPQEVGRVTQQVFNFVAAIASGDIVVASDGARVLGLGRVTGDYRFADGLVFPHQRPVAWLDLQEWRLPTPEGLQSTVRELKKVPGNLVEIERRIFEAPSGQSKGSNDSGSTGCTIQQPQALSGIAGRIQAILERKGQVILYGPPGTGKTYWAKATAKLLAAMHGDGVDSVQTCTFHPGYGYEDFLEGYRPVAKDGLMTFELRDGIFKKLCRDAAFTPDRRFYLIIDEINRGDIPRIFGELLTLLEKDKRGETLVLGASGAPFCVPKNVFVIGTMNTADRSIAMLDAALRRRFGFVELMPDSAVFHNASIEGIPLGPWLDALNARVREHAGREARNLQIGHAYLLEDGQPITQLDRFVQVLRDDIIPLLEEYTYEEYALLEKILGKGMVDLQQQRIREELFEPSRSNDLIQILIAASPGIATSQLAVVAEAASEKVSAENDDEDEAAVASEASPGASS